MSSDRRLGTWTRGQLPLFKLLAVLLLVILAGAAVLKLTVTPEADRAAAGTTTTTVATAEVGQLTTDSALHTASSTTTPATTSTATAAANSTTDTAPPDGKTSAQRRLVSSFMVKSDDLQPKSIVSSETGLFFAQNMMYRHNMMVFDRAGNTVTLIPDNVDLAAYGIAGGVEAQGSPVEAVFTPDSSYVYVSNYKMYGDGFDPSASDDCDRGDWDDSYVYKINTTTFQIEKVIATGSVPKFMAITPDGSRLLVSNWCGFDVSVIDLATDTEITRIDVGRHPRGIAITQDSRFAYVTIMGENKILKLDLSGNYIVSSVGDAGRTPRHLQLSPDDRFLYVSNNHENLIRKIDLNTNSEAGTAATGVEPRTMAISDDGESLYVVNYEDVTISKVRTSDMEILQTEQSGYHPVGVTYDKATRQVWVANYAGSLHVFVDQ
ncbi:MAG: YncE family protein [Ilumatobacteraceae bacterium]|nr:YncE family protein [Ilumatobacteraceae bacterium]